MYAKAINNLLPIRNGNKDTLKLDDAIIYRPQIRS